eukprot:3825114-Pleurochrysis_carterae.AAC.2
MNIRYPSLHYATTKRRCHPLYQAGRRRAAHPVLPKGDAAEERDDDHGAEVDPDEQRVAQRQRAVPVGERDELEQEARLALGRAAFERSERVVRAVSPRRL